jgi:hypothetical protein
MKDPENLTNGANQNGNGGHGVAGKSGPPGNKNNLKHGYYSLVKLVRNRRGALDRRTILGKMVLETVRQLETDLGGDLSTAERMLVADVALDTLLLQALNNEVADASPIIQGKDGLKAHPVYQLRAQLVALRRETLKLLGIKRVSKTLTVTECSRPGRSSSNPER